MALTWNSLELSSWASFWTANGFHHLEKNVVLFQIIFDYCDDWGHWLLVIIGVPSKVSLGTLVLCSTGLCHLAASINWFKTSTKEQVRLTSLFSFIQVAWWPHQVTITYAATSLYSILNMHHQWKQKEMRRNYWFDRQIFLKFHRYY